MTTKQPSSGLPALDKVLHGIRLGDNIVWQVDTIDDYLPIVTPLVVNAKANGEKLVYFRFAQHKELVPKDSGVQVYQLYPEDGFELFISKIHEIIKRTGKGVDSRLARLPHYEEAEFLGERESYPLILSTYQPLLDIENGNQNYPWAQEIFLVMHGFGWTNWFTLKRTLY